MSAMTLLRCLLVAVLVWTYPGDARAEYDTSLVSRLGLEGDAADEATTGASISGNGQLIAFYSPARNLAPGSDRFGGVFVKDVATGALELASREDGPDGGFIEGDWPTISRGGRFVCWVAPAVGPFWLEAPTGQLVVRDLREKRTRRVPGSALHSLALQSAGYVPSCSISSDGRRVAYSTLDRLVPEDDDGQPDVYLHDFETGDAALVSVGSGDPQGPGAIGPARMPVMTPDARFVAFFAFPGPAPAGSTAMSTYVGTKHPSHVYLHDTTTGATELVSRPTGCDARPPDTAPSTVNGSRWPTLSDDGRYVAFRSGFHLDPTVPPPTSAIESDDGFVSDQIYVRDRDTCRTHLVSRASGPNGNIADDFNNAPSMSADGRLIAFDSRADNLDREAPDGPNRVDVFVRDWQKGRTALVSRATGVFGPAASGSSNYPYISAKGKRVLFSSNSDNLTAAPTGQAQIYVREIIGRRRLLPADRPGKPKLARASYRRGRSGGGGLVVAVSEYVQLRLDITRVAGAGRRGIVRRVVGEEGANRIALPSSLRPGQYALRFKARDFNQESAQGTVYVRVPPKRRR